MTNLYWPVYKNLEKEVIELSYNIYFDDIQFEYLRDDKGKYYKTPPYSLKIGDLLVRCCTEIEALIQELTRGKDEEVKNTPSVDSTRPITVGCRLKYLHDVWKLDKKVVLVSCSSMFFQKEYNLSFVPFQYTKEDDNDYYSAYNAIKHDRNAETIYKGNIRFLLRAMAALYLLNIYYRDENFGIGTVMNMMNFDSSLQSDVFSVKYKLLNSSNYKGDELLFIPDVTYVGVLTEDGQRQAHKAIEETNQNFITAVINQITSSVSEENINELKEKGAMKFLIDSGIGVPSYDKKSLRLYLNAKCEAVLNKGQNILTKIKNN